jgi:hypothetical protein
MEIIVDVYGTLDAKMKSNKIFGAIIWECNID